MKAAGRVTTVDFARGLMASAVMIYHLLYWEGVADVERIAFYAVYGFFVISGFSLHIAYRDKLKSSNQLMRFVIRRFARIAPLFYTAIVLSLLQQGHLPDRWPILLAANLSLALGLMNPGDTSMLVGGWSIGVEIVFYIVFPWILIIASGSIRRIAVFAIAAFLLQVAFLNDALLGAQNVGQAWVRYTQPIAFGGYFAAGMFFAELYKAWPRSKGEPAALALALMCLVPFILIPASDPLDLLRGWYGLLLAMSTIILVGAVSFIKEPTGRLLQFAEWIGELSYSIYLLHPIIFTFLRDHGMPSTAGRIGMTMLGTVVAAYFVHRFIEKPCRAFGRRLTPG